MEEAATGLDLSGCVLDFSTDNQADYHPGDWGDLAMEEDQEFGTPTPVGDYVPPYPGEDEVWDEESDSPPCSMRQTDGGFEPQAWTEAPDCGFSGAGGLPSTQRESERRVRFRSPSPDSRQNRGSSARPRGATWFRPRALKDVPTDVGTSVRPAAAVRGSHGWCSVCQDWVVSVRRHALARHLPWFTYPGGGLCPLCSTGHNTVSPEEPCSC